MLRSGQSLTHRNWVIGIVSLPIVFWITQYIMLTALSILSQCFCHWKCRIRLPIIMLLKYSTFYQVSVVPNPLTPWNMIWYRVKICSYSSIPSSSPTSSSSKRVAEVVPAGRTSEDSLITAPVRLEMLTWLRIVWKAEFTFHDILTAVPLTGSNATESGSTVESRIQLGGWYILQLPR